MRKREELWGREWEGKPRSTLLSRVQNVTYSILRFTTKKARKRQSSLFSPFIAMGEHLKRAWIGYKKYKLVMRIIAAFVGIAVGIAGCIAFAMVYHNYNAASWAGVSAIFAIVFLHLHFAVRRDLERVISRNKFNVIMWIGFVGMCSGIIGFIINIAVGVKNHETGEYKSLCSWRNYQSEGDGALQGMEIWLTWPSIRNTYWYLFLDLYLPYHKIYWPSVRSRLLDIGQVHFLCVYGRRGGP